MKTPGQIAFEEYLSAWNPPEKTALAALVKAWPDVTPECRVAWEAAASAVLASQWRSVDDPPEDADSLVFIAWENGTLGHCLGASVKQYACRWMYPPPLPTPAEPTPEERERAEFEAWWVAYMQKHHDCDSEYAKYHAHKAWSAARIHNNQTMSQPSFNERIIIPPLLPTCGICGCTKVTIRAKYPKGPMRSVCPTCLMERMEMIHDFSAQNYGNASCATPTTKEDGEP